MQIQAGDKVQIKNGAIDLVNKHNATAGKMYGEGGPLWATVSSISYAYKTLADGTMELVADKIQCVSDKGIVVWNVKPGDIADAVIKASDKLLVGMSIPATVKSSSTKSSDTNNDLYNVMVEGTEVLNDIGTKIRKKTATPYKLPVSDWDDGRTTKKESLDVLPEETVHLPSNSPSTTMDKPGKITFNTSGASDGFRSLTRDELDNIGSNSVLKDGSVIAGKNTTITQDADKKRELLKDNYEYIQNGYGYPILQTTSTGLLSAKYDYQIIPGDNRYPKMIRLEDKLKQARAAYGIPVHGDVDIARAMKYYMYNRYKTPDSNMAFHKTTTHVFFTRPDLNLLTYAGNGKVGTLNKQASSHSDTVLLWRRNPDLFKLLTDGSRCGDSDNFNLLLSNQVRTFDVADDTIGFTEVGKSWSEHTMSYGDTYTGKQGGTFTCTFEEVEDLSVINLMTLWINYIANVSTGLWKPSYNLQGTKTVSMSNITKSHVYTRTLDYAASAYVFICGPDGSDVLYWTKYYGIFPLSTGSSTLSWDSNSQSATPRPSIQFRYMFKEPLSAISLVELNNACGLELGDTATSIEAFSRELGHSTRPFTGPPFVEIKYGEVKDPLRNNGVKYNRTDTHIRLRFKSKSSANLSDELLYSRSYNGNDPKLYDKPHIIGDTSDYQGNSNTKGKSYSGSFAKSGTLPNTTNQTEKIKSPILYSDDIGSDVVRGIIKSGANIGRNIASTFPNVIRSVANVI